MSSCRNCELRNASEHGDAAAVGRVGALVAQGSAKMATFVQNAPMPDVGQREDDRAVILTATLMEKVVAHQPQRRVWVELDSHVERFEACSGKCAARFRESAERGCTRDCAGKVIGFADSNGL